MAADMVIGMLFSGATALAGLILVFLGGTINAYESYESIEKRSVRNKFRARAWLGFAGFVFAILSALTALSLVYFDSPALEQFSFVTILVSFGFVIALAILAVKEI